MTSRHPTGATSPIQISSKTAIVEAAAAAMKGGPRVCSTVPHANWATMRFPDINSDGRADYIYIGEGGSLKYHMNIGSALGEDVLFYDMGGIATGTVSNINNLVFADIDSDGLDDYLIWDNIAGLISFLNQLTNREGVPLYVNQGPPKTIADGITQSPRVPDLFDLPILTATARMIMLISTRTASFGCGGTAAVPIPPWPSMVYALPISMVMVYIFFSIDTA